MISQLEGKIAHSLQNAIILDVSGVGYKINLTLDTAKKIKAQKRETVRLWTHLAVRENSLDLYGFSEKKELEFFEMLVSISGIGPKSALAILNVADVETISKAVSSGDSSYLTKVSGIGKKSAERIVIELQDKLGSLSNEDSAALKEETEALDALTALGYSTKEARDALREVPKGIVQTGEKIKTALKLLGK